MGGSFAFHSVNGAKKLKVKRKAFRISKKKTGFSSSREGRIEIGYFSKKRGGKSKNQPGWKKKTIG